MVGLDDVRALLHPSWFYDSMSSREEDGSRAPSPRGALQFNLPAGITFPDVYIASRCALAVLEEAAVRGRLGKGRWGALGQVRVLSSHCKRRDSNDNN